MADFDGVNLADLLRGLPDALDRTKDSLEGFLGPLKAVSEGFTDIKSAASVVTDAIGFVADGFQKLVDAATECVEAFAEQESSALALRGALESTGDVVVGLADQVEVYNQSVERKLNKDADDLAAIEAKALALGVQSTQIRSAANEILAFTAITGNATSATKAIAAAHEGHFQKVSRLLGPVSSLSELNEKLAGGFALLEAQAQSTQGKFEGIEIAVGNLQESIGGVIVRSDVFQAILADLRTGLDFTIAVFDGLVKLTHEYGTELEVLFVVTTPIVAAFAAMASGAHQAFQALFSLEQQSVELGETLEEEAATLTDVVKRQAEGWKQRAKLRAEAAAEAKAAQAAELLDLRQWTTDQETEAKRLDRSQQLHVLAQQLGFDEEARAAELHGQNLEDFVRRRVLFEELNQQQEVNDRTLFNAQIDALRKADQAAAIATAKAEEETGRETLAALAKQATEEEALAKRQATAFAGAIQGAIAGVEGVFVELGKALGDGKRTTEQKVQDLTLSVLRVLGSFALTMGNLVIASGIAAAALANPVTAIPAGIALAAIGAGILLATAGVSEALSQDRAADAAAAKVKPPNLVAGDRSNRDTGSATVSSAAPGPQAGGSRTINLIVGSGAIVGGDGRAVGQDLWNVLASASPSWAA